MLRADINKHQADVSCLQSLREKREWFPGPPEVHLLSQNSKNHPEHCGIFRVLAGLTFASSFLKTDLNTILMPHCRDISASVRGWLLLSANSQGKITKGQTDRILQRSEILSLSTCDSYADDSETRK